MVRIRYEEYFCIIVFASLCNTTHFMILFSSWDPIDSKMTKRTLISEMEPSQQDRTWDTNLLKLTTLLSSNKLVDWSKEKVVRCFQRSFHRLDKIQVLSASFVSIKFIIWSRTKSGNSLSLSLSSSLVLCIFGSVVNFPLVSFPSSIDTSWLIKDRFSFWAKTMLACNGKPWGSD